LPTTTESIEKRSWYAFGPQYGPFLRLYAKAIKHVTALEAVLIPVLEPILNPVWVLLDMGEKPSRYAFLGGAIVLGAVTIRAVASLRSRPPV